MLLAGKVALVTGGTKGIGAATAVELARRGADVAINGRYDDESAHRVKSQIEALGHDAGFGSVDVYKIPGAGMDFHVTLRP